MKKKKPIVTCFACTKQIKDKKIKYHQDKPIHANCEKIIQEALAKALEIEKQWQESLTKQQKKILQILQSSGEMTIFDIHKMSNVSLSEINIILRSFREKVKKTAKFKNGQIEFIYKYSPDLILKEQNYN